MERNEMKDINSVTLGKTGRKDDGIYLYTYIFGAVCLSLYVRTQIVLNKFYHSIDLNLLRKKRKLTIMWDKGRVLRIRGCIPLK